MSTFARAYATLHFRVRPQGITEIRAAGVAFRQDGQLLRLGKPCAMLAEGYALAMQYEEGLRAGDEGLAHDERVDDRCAEAELYRIRGELLRQRGDDVEEVEECLRQAIAVARAQEAKSWELRATMSLARLLRDQGRAAEAREALAAIYGWFTEGFDTSDLVDARELLEQLGD